MTPDQQLAARLRAASVLVDRVDVVQGPAGSRIARVHLDALLVRARALQQGLPDDSIAAAAISPRVHVLLAHAVAGTDARCAVAVPGCPDVAVVS